jgi:imidazolonepropionase-like amidohydrolase
LRASRFADVRVAVRLRVDTIDCEVVLNEHGARSVALSSEVPLSMGTLAQLVFGYRAARSLVPSMATTPEAAGLLDVLWSQPAPFVWFTDRF